MPGKKSPSPKAPARNPLRVTDALEQMEARRRKPTKDGKPRGDLDLDFIP